MAEHLETDHQLEELRQVLLKPDALAARISPLLVDILAEHVNESRDEIAQAIAPAVGEAIRRQVYQAREDVIDALYPVIGQMIARAMTEAVRNLAQSVDTRLRHGFQIFLDPRYWRARLRGVSTSEFRLREVLPFSIHEIFLIQRDSGLLICHYSSDPAHQDRDLVSGMLTAIRSFAREAFGRSESGELGAISYAEQHIVLEAGGAAYLAIVIEGIEPPDYRETMRRALVQIHERHYDDLRHFDGSNRELVDRARQVFRETLLASGSDGSPRQLSGSQRLIVGLFGMMLLVPILLFGLWIGRVEARFGGLLLAATATATATMTATTTATTTPTATATTIPTATATTTPTATATASATPTATATNTPTITPTPSPFIGVMIGNVFLYDTPDESSTRTSLVAPLGAPVEVLAQWGDWYRVRLVVPDRPSVELVGWVPSRWVGLIEPVPAMLITPTTTP